MTSLLFLLSCSESSSKNDEDCDGWTAPMTINEVCEGWSVSMQDIVDEINQYDTCVWENDGSITRFNVHLSTLEEHQAPVENDLQYTFLSSSCSFSATFFLYTTYYSEDGEILLEDHSRGSFYEDIRSAVLVHTDPPTPYRWSGNLGYTNTALPPSHPPEEGSLYGINLLAEGDIIQGNIKEVVLQVLELSDQIDVAYCYKE